MKLYEIANAYENIISSAINPETGEINETMLAKLDDISADANQKGIAVASYIKNMEAERDAIDSAQKKMVARKKRLDSDIEWLENYLHFNMTKLGISKISCPYFNISMRNNPVSVDIEDEASLPEKYINIVTERKINKTMIRDDLKAGIAIPGASLKETTRVDIR